MLTFGVVDCGSNVDFGLLNLGWGADLSRREGCAVLTFGETLTLGKMFSLGKKLTLGCQLWAGGLT